MSVNLSNCTSLTKIDKLAFSSNGPLQNLDMSNCSSLEIIEESAFDNSALKNLDLSTCTNLKTIGANAFGHSRITEGKIPLSLTTLTDDAFKGNPGNNDKKQVYLYTPDKTNPNNLKDTDYHLINPETKPDDFNLYTFEGTTITGLTEEGRKYFLEHHEMILPGKNPHGQDVTAIGEEAFLSRFVGDDLISVDFSKCIGLKDIGSKAFFGNKITSLDLSGCTNLTNIGFQAFSNNQLVSLDLLGCTSLESIGNGAFQANRLTTLNLSGCTSLKTIDKAAFAFNKLASIDLSGCVSLTSIDNVAFFFNELASLDLSGCTSLTSIGQSTFASNKLTSLDLSKCTSLVSIGDTAFQTNQLKTSNIPLSLTTLADNAFKDNLGNNDKKQVYLYTTNYTNPNNLQDTEYHLINPITDSDDSTLYTFEGTIITGLSERGQKYFETHHDMKLPAKNPEGEFVTEIGKSAFNGKNLKSVDFSNCLNLVKIGPWAFTNNYITNLDLSPCQNLKIIAEHAFDNSHIDKIDLSNLSKLETIENEAFNNNQSTSLTFKNNTNLKNIGKFAFNQNNLTTLDLSGCPNLLNIEEGVFSGGNITSLDLSVVPNISFIGRAAFSDNQITSVNLSGCKNLKSIGEIAFIKNKITDLDLSPCENLEEIGSYSFSENGLNSVNFKGLKNLKTIKYGAFMVNNIKIVDFSDCANLVNLEEAVFYKNKIESLDMSKCISLKNIPGWIFGENQLKTAKISSSITSIDESSFANNPGNNAKNQVYLYTPRRNNPMNLSDTNYHLVDPITFTIKKVDAKGNPMEGVEFAFYKVDRPTPPAPPQNGTNKINEKEIEISSENVPSAVGGPTISMPDIDLELITDGPIPEFFPDPKTIVGVKPIFITATTDKNGTAEATLPYSPYFLVENETIPGYSINNTVTPIDATTEGKIITYTDYEVSIEIPETGTLGTIPYILLALILVGGAYVVLRKKKEEEK